MMDTVFNVYAAHFFSRSDFCTLQVGFSNCSELCIIEAVMSVIIAHCFRRIYIWTLYYCYTSEQVLNRGAAVVEMVIFIFSTSGSPSITALGIAGPARSGIEGSVVNRAI